MVKPLAGQIPSRPMMATPTDRRPTTATATLWRSPGGMKPLGMRRLLTQAMVVTSMRYLSRGGAAGRIRR
eukprot:symbB.v1.2.014453.t1/scaffold1056.1/size140729/2